MKPSLDPNSDKYPDRIFWGGQWRTQKQIARYRERNRKHKREKRSTDPIWAQRERERRLVENLTTEQIERRRKRVRESTNRLSANPEWRRKRTFYLALYRHNRKRSKYANEGLTLGNHDEENRQSRDRTTA